ncbi:MAG: PRD domain-containing protein [Selenomonadaceae bacterium]|nr:PRD domain-containing protein [Selenomonadaceae bacterium]
MSKNPHKQKIISYLIRHREFIKAEELARILGLSSKTIYRAIQSINDEFGSTLIISERGKGIKLDYDKYIHSVEDVEVRRFISDYSPIERRNKILEKLLLAAPQKRRIRDLFEPFYIGESTIFNDEKLMDTFLSPFDLQLVRSDGYLNISGSEKNIRKALAALIESKKIEDLTQFVSSPQFSNSQDVNFVRRQIEYIERQLQSDIPYPYNVNLFSHFYILINRFRTSQKRAELNEHLTEAELHEMQADPLEFGLCQAVIKNAESYLVCKLPEIEVYFLYQYLISSLLDINLTKEKSNFSDKVNHITKDLITGFEARYNGYLNTFGLYERLASHVKPMLNREKNGIVKKNALPGQIQHEYGAFFKYSAETVKDVSKKYNLF